MNVLEWFLGSQALPAGAIDVVAVRHEDGSLLCSPFHIKLGKAAKKGEKKIVKLRVNGKEVDVFMKLGPAGEAFFVERTKELRREGLSSSFLDDRSLLSPAFDDDKTADLAGAYGGNDQPTALSDALVDTNEEPMYALDDNDIVRLDPDFRVANISNKKPAIRDRSFSENDVSPLLLSSPSYTTSSLIFPILEENLQVHNHKAEYLPPSSSVGMRRERSKSDMSLFENRLDKAALAFPKSESSKSLDKTLAAAIGDNPSSDEKSLKSIPKKNDVSWIWRWGYLPVKSAPAAITDLPHSSYSLSQAESKDASMPLTPRLASSEMRETADDDKSPLVSSPLLSPGARRAIKDENVTNFTKSPPRALFSLNDVAVEKEHESQIFRNEEGSLFLNENDHMDFLAPSKSDRCDYSAEYRIGLDDSAHKKEENDVELALSTSHRFSALSKCGHLLNLSPSMAAARLDFPTTSEKLLELLYAHRLTSADFVLLENMSLDDDQSVVVIVDDFLLTLDVANILFATVGLDAHGNQESEGSVDILHVDEQSIEQAIEQYYSGNNGEEQQKLVLPAWVGKRISTWTSVDERMGRHQSHAYDEECFEEAPNTSFEHRHILTSPADKEFSTPMSSLKEEMFGGSHRDGLVYMNSSGKINALDFDSWKNSALGWRESFADLMQAYKYQTHVHSSTRSNDDLAGILAAATSRDNSHHKPSRDSCNSPDDDYFFRSHDEEDLLHPPHITPFKTPQEAQYGDEAMEEATSSSVADSIELEQQRDVQGIHGDLVSKVDFESASKNESSLNVSSRMDRMSTIVEEEQEGETDGDHLSLQDIALEDISPEPAGGDFYDSDTDSYMSLSLEDGESGQDDRNMDDKDKVRRPRYRRYRYRKVLVPSKEQLELLGLVDGENEISFEVEDCPPVVAQAYVWPADAKIVVADLEGVVINSSKPVANNVWSSFLGASTPKTSVVEETVKLLNDVETRGFKVLFFSQSTNVGHSKDYLNKFAVGGLKLPPAPIFKSPDSLIQAFGASRTDVFKASALRGLRGLFPSYNNPYHAAFVSKTKDVVAFQRNNFPEGRIFVVDEKLHVRTSNRTNAMPLKEFVEMAREIFPDQIPSKSDGMSPGKPLKSVEDEYCDFSYWKVPLPSLDDLP